MPLIISVMSDSEEEREKEKPKERNEEKCKEKNQEGHYQHPWNGVKCRFSCKMDYTSRKQGEDVFLRE